METNDKNASSRAIVTVIGADKVGIIAKVSGKCSEFGVNILDITQKVYDDNVFAMIMYVDTSTLKISFADFADAMKKFGSEEMGVMIRAVHEEIFNAMHRI